MSRLWKHSLAPSVSHPLHSWRKQHLSRALPCTSHLGLMPMHLLKKQRLNFASSSPWDSLSQRKIIVNRKTHLVSSYFQYFETVCDSSGAFWASNPSTPSFFFSSYLDTWQTTQCAFPASVHLMHIKQAKAQFCCQIIYRGIGMKIISAYWQ